MRRKHNAWVSPAALIALVVLLVALITGCNRALTAEAEAQIESERFTITKTEFHGGDIYYVIVDSETGFEYLYIDGGGYDSGLVRLDPVEVPETIAEEIEEVIPTQEAQDEPAAVEPEPEVISLGKFKITAYCSCAKCCGRWAANRPVDANGNEIVYTASGAVAEQGRTIAVDPKVIPYGTMVFFNGQAWVAEDTGSDIKGKRIDVYFDNHEDAKAWEVQYHEVSIERGESRK